jgi:hypothetical protein
MAPFITFTEKAGEADAREIFINAEHIVQATYLHGSGDLRIFVINKTDSALHTLHGQEATDALKVLRSLKG